MYAIIEIGGKQYRVSPGATINVGRLEAAEGDKLEMARVLLLADEGKVMVGTPIVAGAKVTATVVGEGKGEKLIIYRYKAKVRFDKKTGHRQKFTRLTIDSITPPGAGEVKKNGA